VIDHSKRPADSSPFVSFFLFLFFFFFFWGLFPYPHTGVAMISWLAIHKVSLLRLRRLSSSLGRFLPNLTGLSPNLRHRWRRRLDYLCVIARARASEKMPSAPSSLILQFSNLFMQAPATPAEPCEVRVIANHTAIVRYAEEVAKMTGSLQCKLVGKAPLLY
jgi:hypothetical protein